MKIKRYLCLLIIIGFINGQNPCDDAIYIFLKGANLEDLRPKDIKMLERFEKECSEYELSLKEKQKLTETQKELFKSRFNENINIYDILFILNNNELIKTAGQENYKVLKSELDKMLADYNNKVIDIDNYWKEQSTESVFTGSSFNENGYLSALLSMKNPSQADADHLKRRFTRSTFKDIEKERNRIIKRGETLLTKETEWADIVSYYGGYAEISKLGISKQDKSKFDLDIIFEKVELTGPSTCLAHVKLYGDDDALKLHKIPKNNYKYSGSYNIDYDTNYRNLFKREIIKINFIFENKEFFPKKNFSMELSDSLPNPKNYSKTIKTMIQDLFVPNFIASYENIFGKVVTEYDFDNLSPKQILRKIGNIIMLDENFIESYKVIHGNNTFDDHLQSMTYTEMKEKINTSDVESAIFQKSYIEAFGKNNFIVHKKKYNMRHLERSLRAYNLLGKRFIKDYINGFGEKQYYEDLQKISYDEMKQKLEKEKLNTPWKFD